MKEKEIKKRVLFALGHEEKAVSALKNSLKDILGAIELLNKRAGRIVLTGIGKSSYVGMKIAATLTSLGNESFFLNVLDALHGDVGRVKDGDVVIAISFSGETAELVKLVRYLKNNFGVKIISITGNKTSSLAKLSERVIEIKVKDEGCPIGLAPMSSTTASLVVGDMISAGLVSGEIFSGIDFAKFHPAGSLGLFLKKVEDVMVKEERLPVVSEGDCFIDALFEMTRTGMGVVAVTNTKNKISGVITDGDVRRILLKFDNPKEMFVRDVMTKDPKYVFRGENLKGALSLMNENRITNLFVVDEKIHLIGIVHVHNIIENYA